MRSLNIDLPPDVSDDEACLFLAIRLFEEGRASLGKAAGTAGYTTSAFLEVLAYKGVTTVRYSVGELEGDARDA